MGLAVDVLWVWLLLAAAVYGWLALELRKGGKR